VTLSRLLLAAAGLIALGLGTEAGAAPPPVRVMSVNQCADQLVMMLLPPERIASVSYLADRGAATPALAAEARRLRRNQGLAEEVLAEKPDLIVAGRFTTGTLKTLARKVGIPVIELDPAASFQDIRVQTLALGRALGAEARARALIAGMDAELAELARTAPGRSVLAIGWNGGGRVAGRASLFDAILTAAGGRNPAAAEGWFERALDLEQLLAMRPRPDLLLYGRGGTYDAARDDGPQHPALLRAFRGRRLAYDEAAYQCGTPYAARQAKALRQAMLTMLRAAP
jgi:iron complex transport system substrate-binding protein